MVKQTAVPNGCRYVLERKQYEKTFCNYYVLGYGGAADRLRK